MMPSWLTRTWRRRLGAEQKERSHRWHGNFFTDCGESPAQHPGKSPGRAPRAGGNSGFPGMPAGIAADPRALTLPCSLFMCATYSSRSGNHEWHTPQLQPLPLALLPDFRGKRLRLALRSSGELGGSSSSVELEDSSEFLDTGVSRGSGLGVSRAGDFLEESSLDFWGWWVFWEREIRECRGGKGHSRHGESVE